MKLRQYTDNMLDNPQSVLLRSSWMSIAGIKQGLMYSNYSGPEVRNSIMKMLAPDLRKVSVKTFRVLMNDFEVREVLFRSKKS